MHKSTYSVILVFFVCLLAKQQNSFAQVTPQTFNCTGSPQNFTVPPCVTTLTVEAWGAGGGGGGIDTYTGSPGGGGAYATSIFTVTPGQVLTVIVGCGGLQGGACQGNGPGGAGGYGLGTGGNGGNSGPNGCSGPGGGGGGGTGLMNGGTIMIVAGGGGGGGGGGNYGDGANGGGGGQAGSSQSSPGGILGASGTTNGLPGATTGNDGAGGGGGGGGLLGGGGGQVPGTDYGGSGGAGGTSLGTTVLNGNGQTPGNAGSPNLCAGCAIGGNGGSGAPGVPGDLVITYNAPAPITGTISTTSSCGLASATVTASGGNGSYTYSWAPSGGTSNVATLTNGSYTVTITDGLGCTGTETINVVLPPALTLTAAQTNVPCNGMTTGSATATASGGTGPYTYAWSPGPPQISTNGIATNLSGGTTYTVGVQDAVGCQDTLSLTITQPAVLQQTLTATNPICAGASSVLNDVISGGTAPYSITWSSGGSSVGAAVSATVTPAVTTTYSASVQDANSCTNTVTVNVIVNPLPTPTASCSTPVCETQTINFTGAGGLTYTWTGPNAYLSTTQNPSIVNSTVNMSGTYTLVVTDNNNCSNSITTSVVVNPTPAVSASSGAICAGGSTTLTATGGVTYAWLPATGLSSASAPTVTANPSATTVYTITGTNNFNCSSTATSTVTVNPLPIVTATSGTICAGSSVTLNANGATTYSWIPGTGLSSTSAANVTASPGSSTSYTVVGLDNNGCMNFTTCSVTVNPLPTPTATCTSPVCVNQTINFTGSGGTTYTWSCSNGFTSNIQNPTIPLALTNMTGTYSLSVTDNNNCTNTTTVPLTVNPLPTVTVNSATICLTASTTLTAAGATNYTWSPATGLSSSNGTSVTASPTVSTTYTITGTDANSCTSTGTSTVTVNPTPPVSATSATVCPGFSAILTAGGATSYTWSTGATTPAITVTPGSTTVYTVTGNSINCPAIATGTITVNPAMVVTAGSNSPLCQGSTLNLTANTGIQWTWTGPQGYGSNSQNPTIANAQPNMSGAYSLSATDANGCIGTSTVNIVVNQLPVIGASSNSAVCAGNTINLSGNGGTSYTWSGPGGYNSTSQNPAIVNAMVTMSGTYSLTIKDNNNCINSTTTQVLVNPVPVVTVNSPTICTGSSAPLSALGGVAYAWNPNTGLSSSSGANVTANPTSTTIYTVTGVDINTCTNVATSTVTVNPLPAITATSGTICIGSSTTLTAAGGSTYTWTPSTGLNTNQGSSVTAGPGTNSAYTISGTDANGCINTATCAVTVHPLPNIKAGPQTTSGCEPLPVNFSNTGTSQGTCLWTFGDGTTDNSCTPMHNFTSAGTFAVSLQVTDSNNCVNTSSATVIVYPLPKADFYANPQPTSILDPDIHFFDASSMANVTAWSWDLGDGHTSIVQFPSHVYNDTGTYAVQLIVTSNFGCKDSIIQNIIIADEYLVYVPNAFTPNLDGTNDEFLPKGEGIVDYKLYIYDRWGTLVFSSTDQHKGWDGRLKGTEVVQEDVYVWKLEVKNKKGEPKLLKGVVSLLK